MRIKLFGLLIFLVVVLFAFESVKACSCADNPSPIGAYKTTPIVFIGKVKSIVEDKVKIERFGEKEEVRTGLVAYLDVIEPFKGIKQKEATIITGGGGGDCGFHFGVGKTYFVFASPLKKNSSENIVSATIWGNSNPSKKKLVGDAMTTHICTLTNELDYMQNELEIIRGHLGGNPQPRIYGTILEYLDDFDGTPWDKFVGFVPNIKIVVEGKKGKFESLTDDKGRFSIKNLPLGKYNLKFLLPETLMNKWDWEKLEYPVEIKTKEDSINFDFSVQTSGVITGTLFDSLGNLAPNQVQLSLIPVEFINQPNLEQYSRSEWTKQGGKYVFDGVKEGKYLLGVSIAESPDKGTPYPKTYYPFGGDFSNAKIIEIKKGQKLTNIDIKLPKELERFVVEGVVLDSKGNPVLGADVNIYDAETPDGMVFGFSDDVKTDTKGQFKITGFKGRKYLLHAYKDTDYFAGRGIQSERVEVTFSESAKMVKLILNKNGIFTNQLK